MHIRTKPLSSVQAASCEYIEALSVSVCLRDAAFFLAQRGVMNSKQKGKRGELELAQYLRQHGYHAQRGQQYKGSPESPDVVCAELDYLHIEVKRTERLQLYPALDQSTKDAGSLIPTVFHRSNNNEWVVILKASDFLKLIPQKE